MDNPQQSLKHLTDICVKCGLCLPHCPTYALDRQEAESPRGRIAIIEAVTEGDLSLTPSLETHLDHCLQCGSCTDVCPAKVPYNQIITNAKAQFLAHSTLPRRTQRLAAVTERIAIRPRLLAFAMRGLRLLQSVGIHHLLKMIPVIRQLPSIRLFNQLPQIRSVKRWQSFYPAKEPCGQNVALFLGCIGRHTDGDVLEAAISLLNHLGYGVHVPDTQGCCGALSYHRGDQKTAKQLKEHNHNCFNELEVMAIVHCSSGCHQSLASHSALPVMDVQDFLLQSPRWQQQSFTPLKQILSLHIPCTQQHSNHYAKSTFALLKAIPELTIEHIQGTGCCGAAGEHMLKYPQIAAKHRQILLESCSSDTILTQNPGCRLHLRAQNTAIAVIHPLILLKQQLPLA